MPELGLRDPRNLLYMYFQKFFFFWKLAFKLKQYQ